MIEIGMHTDNWRHLDKDFEFAATKIRDLGLRYIEFAVIDGQDFIEGLGYSPAVPVSANEIRLRQFLDRLGLEVSQIDAAYPLTGPMGAAYGVTYVQKAIKFARAIGCPRVDTTDGARRIPGYSDEEVVQIWKQNIRHVLEMAEDYDVIINIEPHGPYTNNVEIVTDVLRHFDSPRLGVNFDTGNTFIAGHDPLEFLKAVRPWLNHLHCKDVPRELAAAERGQSTGISSSASAIGNGANAENIRRCIRYLKETDWDGVFSLELLGVDEALQESVRWTRSEVEG